MADPADWKLAAPIRLLAVRFERLPGPMVKRRWDTRIGVEAREQVGRCLDALGLAEGWLLRFDLRATRP